MDSKRLILVLAALLMFSGGVANAQGETPEAVAKAAMELAQKGNWSEYTRLMHPEALAEAKRIFRPIVVEDAGVGVRESFFGVDSISQYDALSDSAAFATLMTNLTTKIPTLAEAVTTANFMILGAVPEGEELVHVVYRSGAKAEGLTVSKAYVATLRRHEGHWRLLLTGSVEALADRLSKVIKLRPTDP